MSRDYPPRPYSSNYHPRRYQESRDSRNPYDDKRDRMNNMYEDKYSHRNHSRDYTSQPISNQMGEYNRYDIRRPPSSGYMDRERRPKSFNHEVDDSNPNQRFPSDIMSKRERTSADYPSEQERIAELIKKEYKVNPPIQLNLPKPLHQNALWD